MQSIGTKTMYVSFNFGSFAYVGVTLYEGLTIEECLKIRSKDIDGYIENGKYTALTQEG